jgi:hypothetical protein
MRESMKPVVILLAVALILATAIGAWFLFGPGSRPRTPIPPPEKPAMVDAYDRLLTAYKATQGGQPVDVNLDPFPEDALDIIAGYEQLFTHVNSATGIDDMEEVLHKPPYERTDAEKSVITEFLVVNKDLIDEIRQMAERGGPLFPLDFSTGPFPELPHLERGAFAPIRQCPRILCANAVLNAVRGRHALAVDDLLAAMKLGDAFALEPVILSRLARLGIYGGVYRTVENSLDGGDLSPELTELLVTHLAQADRREGLVEALRAELYTGEMHFWALKRGDPTWYSDESPEGPTGVGALTDRLFARLFSRIFWRLRRKEEESFKGIMNRWIAAAKQPYYEAAPELELIKKEIDAQRSILLMLLLHPNPPEACEPQAYHETLLDLMQMGLLLEQYKAQNGSYPATLDAIASDLGGSVPVDPFTGEAYRYRPSFDSFLLYSVGMNLVDDGGKHDWREGDIVWRGERKKANDAAQAGGE